MQRYSGTFIIVDGITGSGKSTVLRAVEEQVAARGQRIFRQHDWTQTQPPRFQDIEDFDVYFTFEPTRNWVGAAIRQELSRTDDPYTGAELAHAFALDRNIHYRRLIIPALVAGKTVIQDRGVSSSIVYQPVMPGSVPLETILALPGNALALTYAPSALVLTALPAALAASRIDSRGGESKGVFADIEFLKQQEERFGSAWLRELFESRGSRVLTLNTSGTLDQSRSDAKTLVTDLLNHHSSHYA